MEISTFGKIDQVIQQTQKEQEVIKQQEQVISKLQMLNWFVRCEEWVWKETFESEDQSWSNQHQIYEALTTKLWVRKKKRNQVNLY